MILSCRFDSEKLSVERAQLLYSEAAGQDGIAIDTSKEIDLEREKCRCGRWKALSSRGCTRRSRERYFIEALKRGTA